MDETIDLSQLGEYFKKKLSAFGTSPQGVDWNSTTAQEIRFAQLSRVIEGKNDFELLDYGSGFGSFYDFLKALGYQLKYIGFDILPEMIELGRELHRNDPACQFTTQQRDLVEVDYSIASGIFNIRFQYEEKDWTEHVLQTLGRMNQLSRKGFAFNMLTKYSDEGYMKAELYYADPCFYFDYCKQHFARNVALLHDYGLYDFSILVRKDL